MNTTNPSATSEGAKRIGRPRTIKDAVCPICGATFRPTTEGRKICSRECYYASRRGSQRPDLWKRETKQCIVCNADFEVGGRTGRRRDTTRYCSRGCAAKGRFRRGSTANHLEPLHAAYLAGIVDGEGSIMLQQHRGVPMLRLTVSNTHRGLLEWIVSITGIGNASTIRASTERHRESGHWVCNSMAAESVIEQVAPFLIVKKEQAEIGLDFMRRLRIPSDKADHSWQEEYRQKVRGLNKRGPRTQTTPPPSIVIQTQPW